MRRAVNIIVSVVVLALVLWWADTGAVVGRLRGASPTWLALAGLALTVVTLLMAKRWQIIAHAVEIDIDYARAVAEYYIAQLVNLVLPGGVVGDVARAVRVRQKGDLTRAAQSVAADRIVGQVVMFTALGFGLIIALLVPGGIAWPAVTWIGIAAGIGMGAVVSVLSRRDGVTARFLRLILRLLQNLRLLALSLLIAVLLIFSLYACARATGTAIPHTGWFTLIPLVLSAMLVPLSIGGWGWREGAAAALFPLIGASSDAGIAMGIAFGGVMMIAALPGLYFGMRASPAASLPSDREMEIL